MAGKEGWKEGTKEGRGKEGTDEGKNKRTIQRMNELISE